MSTTSMSTPIHQLPQNKPTSATLPDDPEVLNVLSEMEEEVQTAARANSVPIPSYAPPPMPTTSPMMMAPPPNVQIRRINPPTSFTGKWINTDVMQRAGIIAAIALIVFYPKTMEYIYNIPKLAFLEQYDIIVRAFTLGIAVYILTIQFGM